MMTIVLTNSAPPAWPVIRMESLSDQPKTRLKKEQAASPMARCQRATVLSAMMPFTNLERP